MMKKKTTKRKEKQKDGLGSGESDTPGPLQYNSSRTYVAFVIGDGDNVQYVQNSRAGMMRDRTARCAAGGGASNVSACFPLLWSLSPATLHLAPDWTRWYFNTSYKTRADWFVLPPSGDTYSYPSQQSAADQATFVSRTEEDCRLMNTRSVQCLFFLLSVRPQLTPTHEH